MAVDCYLHGLQPSVDECPKCLSKRIADLESENAKMRAACHAALPVVEQRVRLNQSSGSVRALHLLTAALRGESEATK